MHAAAPHCGIGCRRVAHLPAQLEVYVCAAQRTQLGQKARSDAAKAKARVGSRGHTFEISS